MDLAKIRKKSLQAQEQILPDFIRRELDLPNNNKSLPAGSAAEAVPTDEPNQLVDACTAVAVSTSSFNANPVPRPAPVAVERDPLEIILAGRSASGCNDEASFSDDEVSQNVAEEYLEFLIFRVSDEIYGINIMDIKEIIKPREVTEVPRAPAFVTGILSLRGTIISIIDMRLRLGLISGQITGRERVVVIKEAESLSGLLVDEVIQVVRVPNEAVEPAPAVLEGIDRDFVFGIGRSDGRLIIILNLTNIVDIQLY